MIRRRLRLLGILFYNFNKTYSEVKCCENENDIKHVVSISSAVWTCHGILMFCCVCCVPFCACQHSAVLKRKVMGELARFVYLTLDRVRTMFSNLWKPWGPNGFSFFPNLNDIEAHKYSVQLFLFVIFNTNHWFNFWVHITAFNNA